MNDFSLQSILSVVIIALLLSYIWYLDKRLNEVNVKLNWISANFHGLREYLYEIDPQFDDERESEHRFQTHMANKDSSDFMSGMYDSELIESKEKAGKRTLNTPFF